MKITIYNHASTQKNDGLHHEITKAFQDTLLQLRYFLKLEQSSRFGSHYLYHKPWFLLFGPKASGKTSLLKNAELNITQTILADNPQCSGYITDEAIFLDVNGDIVSQPTSTDAFTEMGKQLQACRRQQPLNGVIFVLNCRELMGQTKLQREAQLGDYLRSLQALLTEIKTPTPVYLLFTQLDSLHGFSEFFDDALLPQRLQPCGFMLPKTKQSKMLLSHSQKNLDKLISILNKMVVRKLHHTLSPQKQTPIYQFPLQIEHLKTLLQDTMKWIFSVGQFDELHYLRGVYFCSNQQNNSESTDPIASSIRKTFALQVVQTPSAVPPLSRSYFTHQLLTQILIEDTKRRPMTFIKKWMNQTGLATTALVASVIFSLFLTQNFVHHVKMMQVANSALLQYQLLKQHETAQPELEPVLHQLAILSSATQQIHSSPFSIINLFPFSSVNETQHKLETTYQQAVKTQLLPLLSHYIDQRLSKGSTTQAGELYANLKAYLMLGYPEHMEPHYFTDWLSNAWENDHHYSEADSKRLISLLEPHLHNKMPATTLNLESLNEARLVLNTLPKSFVAYLAIQNQDADQTQYPFTKDEEKLFQQSGQRPTIPYLYTKAAFETVYNEKIPQESALIFQGDWVLGHAVLQQNLARDEKGLSDQLQRIYVKDYVSWWERFVESIGLPNSDDPATMASIFHTLAQVDSPLNKLTHLVRENTQYLPARNAATGVFNQTVVPAFAAFHLHPINEPLLQQAFTTLEHDFWLIDNATDSQKTAFEIATRYFQSDTNPITTIKKQAESMPPSLQRTLDSLTTAAWQTIEAKTEDYINAKYMADVYAEYHDTIEARYPFNKNGTDEVSYLDFNHFFAPKGTFDAFFQETIAPFLDVSTAAWHPKALSGLTLDLPEAVTSQFIRANLIKQMFFADSHEATLQFGLTPVNIDPEIKDMIIEIYGKKTLHYKGSTLTQDFSWPATDDKVSITLESKKGETFVAEETGPWAWFKILDKSNLSPDPDNKHYTLVFVLGKNATQYELTANSEVNPFVPGVMSEFALPAQIMGMVENEATS